MNRTTLLFIAAMFAFIWSAAPLMAEKRIALVIGNSSYTQMQSLANPANDARLMTETLGKLGFEVISAADVDFLGMRRAVKKFGRKLRGAGKDAVGLFYYAGHGVQAQGANFLVPLGAEIEDEADLEIETVSASSILSQMEAAGNTLNLVILDACRNNPFKGKMRSSSRGLARLNAASGSLVAFAAAPGQVAADGSDKNSPYTKALVKAMQVPGLSVEQMFKQVRVSVEAATNQRQTPWEESSLRGDFFFTPEKVEPKPVAIPVIDPAVQEWATIQNTQSTAVLKAYIKRHPKSIYADYARATLEEKSAATVEARSATNKRSLALRESQQKAALKTVEISFWNSVQSTNDASMLEGYLARYPKGDFAMIATAKITALKKEKRQRVASLQTGLTKTFEPTTATDLYELTILLQTELTRVGCKLGSIDGQWGGKGRRALARFKRYAKLALPFEDISPEVIDAVKQRRSRVCPKAAVVKARKKKTRKTAGSVKRTEKNTKSAPRPETWKECMARVPGAGHSCAGKP